ncbi:MAG: TIGR00730 family Rossman fold protein [Boseongicola sp.]
MSQNVFSVCVYCGSKSGSDPAYITAARELGNAIALKKWRLVYGAGDIGLMGAVAESASSNGTKTLGVIPKHLLNREATRGVYGERIITETMHERKKVMFMNADAVVVLPGGAGSLDEFFEVLTWGQLGLHDKPVVLVNVNGFWDPLIELLNHVISQEFAEPSLLKLVTVAENANEAVQILS